MSEGKESTAEGTLKALETILEHAPATYGGGTKVCDKCQLLPGHCKCPQYRELGPDEVKCYYCQNPSTTTKCGSAVCAECAVRVFEADPPEPKREEGINAVRSEQSFSQQIIDLKEQLAAANKANDETLAKLQDALFRAELAEHKLAILEPIADGEMEQVYINLTSHIDKTLSYLFPTAHSSAELIDAADVTIKELKQKLAEAEKGRTARGCYVCDRCGFQLFANILYVQDGSIGAQKTNVAQRCPNDNEPLRIQTRKERCNDIAKVCENQVARAVQAEAERDSIRLENAALRKAVELIVPPIEALFTFAGDQIVQDEDGWCCEQCHSQLDEGGTHKPTCIVNLIEDLNEPLRSLTPTPK